MEKKKNFDGIIIKYEDLIDDAQREFTKILTYIKKKMNIEIDKKKITKSVNSCKFSKLRELEDMHGFKEATNNKFFRMGKKNSWKDELSHDLRTKIEETFKNEMIDLGYL